MLRVLDSLPKELLAAPPHALADIVDGPTLIHLKGRREPPLFASVLQHGNETAGFEAAQIVLRKYAPGGGDRELPRSLSLFVANVGAARERLRRLPGQPDFNRIWPGAETGGTPEHAVMQSVFDQMKARRVFASIDIHNNTGLNPHYGCVNRLEPAFIHLARMFSRTIVYFLRPKGVQSMAFAHLCPAVTLECGRVGEKRGVDHAADYLDACLHLSAFPEGPPPPQDVDLLHTVAVVKISEDASFSFGDEDADLRFVDGLERLNFTELPAGTALAFRRHASTAGLSIFDESGKDVTGQYLEDADGILRTRIPTTPSMLTRDATVIRQDCFCYLMERIPWNRAAGRPELQTTALSELKD